MRDSLEEWDNQGGAVDKPLRRETQGRSGDDADGRRRRAKATKDRNELLQHGSSEPVQQFDNEPFANFKPGWRAGMLTPSPNPHRKGGKAA
ncbi:hypothetical protein ABIE78_004462 [Sinorhizobium fredii]|uniref:Uncharacterized protein n=1 Tax=Sinorhizobium fredii (strain USDA 257) TaxID=1185652 RepID=I3X1K3_SINF2|nr:hypothetical protein [Sinorhizobium fredii]AFL49759.1 hypothetical protein USDA257_c11680 [Sinorhizobium fredii USDA 257]